LAIAGLNLVDRSPRGLIAPPHAGLTVTGRGRAHEDLSLPPSWWHWSMPDPVAEGVEAFLESNLYTQDYRMYT